METEIQAPMPRDGPLCPYPCISSRSSSFFRLSTVHLFASAMSTNTSSTPTLALTADPATVIGPVLVGTMITWFLMGTLVVQAFVFHLNSAGDRIFIRLLVYSLVILDFAQTIFVTQETWFYTITNFNNALFIETSPWAASTVPIMAGLISGIVQLFYSWRIWILSGTFFMRGMAILITLVALMQSLSAIVASSIFASAPTQVNLKHLHPAFDLWLAGSFSADILISACMITILYQARARTVWAHSERMIDRIVVSVIQTGTLTVICAGVDLALFIASESTNIHLAPAIVLGKLYSNSLLATLNGRKSRRATNASSTTHSDSIAMRVQVSRMTERNPADDLHSEWEDGKLHRTQDSGKAAFHFPEQPVDV